MAENHRKLKVYLASWLAGTLILFVYDLIQQGLPGSFGELAARSAVCVLIAPLYMAWVFSERLKLIVLAFGSAALFAIAVNRVFKLDPWLAFGVGGVLVFAIYRGWAESKLVRRALCAAVVSFIVLALAYAAAPLPDVMRVIVALGFAGMGAWAGWWLWPKLVATRLPAGWNKRRVMKESLAQWRSAAAGDDEISGDDFLKPRK